MREMLTNLLLRWRTLWKRRRLESDLEDELAFHLAMREEKNRKSGVTGSAQRSFGNPALVKEDLRDQWTFRAIENFWRDLRYGARMLRRSPGFTLVAILSLAIGIGGNTAIFSVVDAILLRSLPVREPEQLRVVLWTGEQGNPFHGISGYSITSRSGVSAQSSFSYPVFEQLSGNIPQFSKVIGFAPDQVTVVAGASSHYAEAEFVTGNFFDGLGVTALVGRTLTAKDDRTSAAPVAVITYRYWERHLGLELEAVGRTIFINGLAVTVIGVTPKTFMGVQPGQSPDLFVPINLTPLIRDKWYRLDGHNAWVQMMGRLRPGVSERQTITALEAGMQRIRLVSETQHEPREDEGGPWRPILEGGARGIQVLRDQAQPTLLLLGLVIGLMLLIACANLANLLLARSLGRRREIAVRLSIGAGRARLVRQLLTESLLMASLGAGLGLVIAAPLSRLILSVAGGSEVAGIYVHFDWRAITFAAVGALITALLFGLAPAFRATRVDLTPTLKDGSVGAVGPSPRLRTSRLLIAGQVALSTLLLAGAGLFVRTLMNLEGIDPGFQAQRLLLFNADGSRSGYQGDKLVGLYERILQRVSVIPGVRSATLSNFALISLDLSRTSVGIPEYEARTGKPAWAYVLHVGGHFLSTVGIPVLAGRDVDERDGPKAHNIGVVNERFMRDYFRGQSPIGKTLALLEGSKNRIEIVGVCKDAKYDNLKDEVPPTIYLPYQQVRDFSEGVTFELRTAMPPAAIAGAVQRVVAGIDRNVPVAQLRTQEEQIKETLAKERMFAGVVSSFGGIATLLAAIGLYGMMAYAVTRRTNEIGIRLALGAGHGDVQWMVVRESLAIVAGGLMVGIPAALGLTRYVQVTLYGVKPNDAVSFVAAGVLIVVVAALAAWIPARRAARVDPMRALRCE
jgi:predicted permease